MAVLSSVLNGLGAILLIHAVYSSYEHSLLDDITATTPGVPSLSRSNISLPVDIIAETVVSVLLLCFGVVLGATELKPIHMNDWAGRLERSKDARKVTAFGEGGGNPYARLEDRVGFLQVRPSKESKK